MDLKLKKANLKRSHTVCMSPFITFSKRQIYRDGEQSHSYRGSGRVGRKALSVTSSSRGDARGGGIVLRGVVFTERYTWWKWHRTIPTYVPMRSSWFWYYTITIKSVTTQGNWVNVAWDLSMLSSATSCKALIKIMNILIESLKNIMPRVISQFIKVDLKVNSMVWSCL